MDHLEEKLIAHLYRLDCPSPHELGEYHLRLLPGEQIQVISHHLRLCPHCAQELAYLQTYLAELAPDLEFTFRERLQVWIARLIPAGTDTFSPVPALALRGDATEPLIYEAGDVQINLEIQDDPARAGHKTLLGLVMGSEEITYEAHLWQAGEQVQSCRVDELGNFILPGVAPGVYDLILNRITAVIHLPALTIGVA
jgi:hypothetical protein